MTTHRIEHHNAVSVSEELKTRLKHRESLSEAYSIWADLEDIRTRIFLEGRNLVLALIYARMAVNEETKFQICRKVSDLLGERCFNVIYDIIDEYTGDDGDRHLWQLTSIGTYRVNK